MFPLDKCKVPILQKHARIFTNYNNPNKDSKNIIKDLLFTIENVKEITLVYKVQRND